MTDQSKQERLRELANFLELDEFVGDSAIDRYRETQAALREYADLLDRPQEARGIFGWAIEGAWSPVDRPEYWVGSSAWSTDPYKALRLATRESAQQAADLMCAGVKVRIACHEWARNSHHE